MLKASNHYKSDLPSRKALSFNSKYQSESRTSTTLQPISLGLNNQFLSSRRENYLNDGYNKRKKRLEGITLENRKIYQKINVQKSSYSREILKREYDENLSHSRRLSESRLSKRSCSQSSIRSSHVKKNPLSKNKVRNKIYFEQKSVAQLENEEIQSYQMIFKSNQENKRPITKIKHDHHRTKTFCNLMEEKEGKSKFVLPTFIKPRKSKPSLSFKIAPRNYDDDLLHCIAEEMFGKNKNKY